jgi:hypothetical protein
MPHFSLICSIVGVIRDRIVALSGAVMSYSIVTALVGVLCWCLWDDCEDVPFSESFGLATGRNVGRDPCAVPSTKEPVVKFVEMGGAVIPSTIMPVVKDTNVGTVPSTIKPVVDVALVAEVAPASTGKSPAGLASTVEVPAGAVAGSVADSIPGDESSAVLGGMPPEDELPVAPSPVVGVVFMAPTEVVAKSRGIGEV